MAAPVVAIVRAAGAEPTELLERAIARTRFRGRIGTQIGKAISEKGAFSAIIVPALDVFAAGSPAGTDPRLVEHLLDILFDLGTTRAGVGSTRDSSALWLENRDPFMVADLLGYRYETPKGRRYDVIDLAEDVVEGVFPDANPLAGTALSRDWLEADLRILFAANRTDEDDGYSLCLSTLLSVLPLTDKDYHYRHRRDRGAVAAALLEATSVEFAFIDAVISAHGNGGRSPQPIVTDTIIAASDPALADHQGALLMGLDPFVSQVAAPCLRRPRLLEGVRTIGSLDPYPGWVNVDPLLLESTALRRKSVSIDRSVRPLLQQVDRDLFPFSNPANDRVNALLASFFAEADDRVDGVNLLGLLNLWLGQLGHGWRAFATHFDKDSLRRCDAPVNIDPATVGPAAFAAIAGELLPLTELLRGVPPDHTGLRWRSHDGAILFDGVRRYPIPFDAFVAEVEINRTIQYMNDYIGGNAIAVGRDQTGRVTRQIERNLYLPQPNYTILFGGDVIDVTKLETVTYAPGRQRMVWKTIKSANDSAIADDGSVIFEALGDDTLVTIWGRQLFRLPPLLDAIDFDLLPALKQLLVSDAYRRFFRRTFANLEAVAEGRDSRIGRAWADDEETEPLPIKRLTAFVAALSEEGALDVIDWIKTLGDRSETELKPIRIDEDGFRHFESTRGVIKREAPRRFIRELLGDLQRAARVDAGLIQ